MARPLRIEYDGAVYHITSRGNARKPIFKDETDFLNFLDILQKVNKRYNWLCHAYCLMNNHYHLIIETPDGNLSKGMRSLNGIYTQLFNKRHKRVGHIYQGRYKAVLIQKESHLLEVCRYVVLNPVRAKLVEQPEQWKWSSYRATAGTGKPHPCLQTDWVLGQFGRRRKQAEKEYREFVKAGIGEKGIWKNIKGQSILGEEDFIESLINYVKGYEEVQEIPRSQRLLNRPGLKEIFSDGSFKEKQKRNRKIKAAVESYGYSQKEVAHHLKMHYSTISRLMKGQR
ncbi:MAG TPA: helix-turn-helix domain-containing protein [Nitrospirae bacterium]|nr:transposase IS200 like protein [bacterium BMS3Abin10]GBE39064.1 transposase IS200 like protein [bacterium BMS3Bbin08]HDH50374.1 helix-turn-helix domain-containing protein [Nitrospirota bacterium]HDO25813.1 helix-turn-helix domain-containing protein [Nitrospirota bacterium]